MLRINSRSPTALHPQDSYWTPPEATKALMAVEILPRSIADPACGAWAILNILKHDHIIYGSDIKDYGVPNTIIRDYLSEPLVMNGVGIITNPPFRLALEFAQKAINDGADYIAFLLRLNWLESTERKPFFEANPISRIHVFSRRLPMMHREGWTDKKSPSNICFAWFVWDKRNIEDNRPQINFVDWKDHSQRTA